jgi:hypothetical protein
MKRLLSLAGAACALALTVSAQPATGHPYPSQVRTVVGGLDMPRGVEALWPGATLVTQATDTASTVSLVLERGHKPAKVVKLAELAPGLPPAVDVGRHHTVYLLAAGGPPGVGAALYKWRPGYAAPKRVADIGAYQAGDTDPYDLEGIPDDTNPYGVAALPNGDVLVADAAGNDLLKVAPNGDISTVARLKPRMVQVPGAPAGTMAPSEAVATSVTVGRDGYWYVGELRGGPPTTGTSQVWRIKPGSRNALCDPAKPSQGSCRRYADGLTSIVDLAADRRGNIYAVSLSKAGFAAAESGEPGTEIGALYKISPSRKVSELAPGKLVLPGGADVAGDWIYVTSPLLGPPGSGQLLKIRR